MHMNVQKKRIRFENTLRRIPTVVFHSSFFSRLSEVNGMFQCTFFDLVTLTFDL